MEEKLFHANHNTILAWSTCYFFNFSSFKLERKK